MAPGDRHPHRSQTGRTGPLLAARLQAGWQVCGVGGQEAIEELPGYLGGGDQGVGSEGEVGEGAGSLDCGFYGQ